MSTCHPQVRQSEQRHHLYGVFDQAPKTHFFIAKLVLDHPERVLDLGSNLSLGLLDLTYRFVQGTAFSMLL